jgi:hypothetical protein
MRYVKRMQGAGYRISYRNGLLGRLLYKIKMNSVDELLHRQARVRQLLNQAQH